MRDELEQWPVKCQIRWHGLPVGIDPDFAGLSQFDNRESAVTSKEAPCFLFKISGVRSDMLGRSCLKTTILVLFLLPASLTVTPGQQLAQEKFFALQLEALANRAVANRRMAELQAAGVDAYVVKSRAPARVGLYRVRVGRFATAVAARRLGEELRSRNLATDFFVARWEPGGEPPGERGEGPEVIAVTITLTEKGYQPEKVRLSRGVPARLTFIRKVEATCATEVELLGYGIRRELPVNQPVVIEFTPTRAGELTYTCSMKMVGGKILVQ